MRGRRGPQWNQYVSIIVPATRVRVTECFPPETHLLPPKRSLTSGNLRDQSKYPQEHSSGQCIRGRDGGGASTGIAIICNYTGSANLE